MNNLENLTSKGNVYYITSLLFKPPTENILDTVSENLPTFEISLNLIGLDPDASTSLERHMARVSLEELRIEYTRLFVGSPPFKAVSLPYESYWRQKTIMGPPVGELAQLFEEIGLRLSDEFTDLPDHVSVELEFMNQIYRSLIDHTSNGDETETERLLSIKDDFVENHLDWIDDFCVKVERESKIGYYRNLASLTRKLLEIERAEP